MPVLNVPLAGVKGAVQLQIAVLGAGQIGSTFAFQLARAGNHDVTVIARPGSRRLTQLQRDGGIFTKTGDHAACRILDALDESIAYDLVIVTVLAHHVDAVLPALARSRAGCVQFMFNVFDPDRLVTAIGADRCAFGMPFVQAKLDDDGRLAPTIGAAGQKTLMNRQRWVDIFGKAGIPAALEPDMPLWLRCHAPLCVAFESVSVAAVKRGGGASWREALTLAHGVHQAFRLIKSLGQPIYPRSKRLIDHSPVSVLAIVLWSMSRVRSFRELLATGKVECSALVDSIVAAAPLAVVSVDTSAITAMKPV